MPKGHPNAILRKDISQILHERRLQAGTTRTNRARDRINATSKVVSDPPPSGEGGTGILSPLTETQFADRQYQTDTQVIMVSTDGLFIMEVKPIKSINFKDDGGQDVQLVFAAPAPVIVP